VVAAIKDDRTILIAEGEKDVETLRSLGFVATCSPDGAAQPNEKSKWKPEYSEMLRGGDIVILNDNDDPGRAHRDVTATTSLGIAKRVRVLDLARHWPNMAVNADVSDWHAAGHGKEELDALLEQAAEYSNSHDAAESCRRCSRDDGAELLHDVQTFLARFIVYPSDHEKVAHVLWLAHTHLMDAWESTPRIAFLSVVAGSGKTRAMEVSELLVPSPIAAVNVTPAYLFRKVGSEDGPPTILFDEIDTVFGPKAKENEELRALLNSGHRRGAVAGRCVVRGKTVETEEIPSYSAVAMAGLGWLPDTIMSRSIIVRMRRRTSDEKVEPFRRRVHAPEGEALCRRLAAWARAVRNEATAARPDMPSGVEDRNADIWEPLLALADIAGGEWPGRSRMAAVELLKVARDAEPSLNVRLLADLQAVFGTSDAMFTKDILAGLCAIDDGPWNDLKGKPLTDHQLARRLRQYEVQSKPVRKNGVVLKGYYRADLADSWRRYLPPLAEVAAPDLDPDQIVTSVTPSVTPCNLSGDRRNADGINVVTHVTPVTRLRDDGGEVRQAASQRLKKKTLF
jgi:hypothetical protein